MKTSTTDQTAVCPECRGPMTAEDVASRRECLACWNFLEALGRPGQPSRGPGVDLTPGADATAD